MIRKDFLANIQNIANDTRSPNKVFIAMKRITKSTYRILHSQYSIGLLKKLEMKNIGTEPIERQCRKLCPRRSANRTLVMTVIKNRIKDAHKEMRKNKYENTKTWREERKILIEEGKIKEYTTIWLKEKEWMRKILKKRKQKKVEWLTKKYKPRIEIPDEYEGYHKRPRPRE